ncbi:MAG: GNAT family N-acetyltransferase [Chloroflexota bacterium]|nr:GNAT family N-acetyltransferase [Chloroflexota bacterium]
MGHPLWPLYDLRLRTERLELRLPDEDELAELCRVARAGIHPAGEMPFGIPWSVKPSPQFEREFLQFHLGLRASWTSQAWNLELAVFLEGQPIGSQGLEATGFPTLRAVGTGSWLGMPFQRRGIGSEMREAILALAFDGLGAEIATSEAFLDNPASAGVSRRLGYAGNGFGRLAPQGEARDTERFRMTRAAWSARPRRVVGIDGLEASRELFGLEG